MDYLDTDEPAKAIGQPQQTRRSENTDYGKSGEKIAHHLFMNDSHEQQEGHQEDG
jgi:hypothetical protein